METRAFTAEGVGAVEREDMQVDMRWRADPCL